MSAKNRCGHREKSHTSLWRIKSRDDPSKKNAVTHSEARSVCGCLFRMPSAVDRHRSAPLLKEREAYFHDLLERGYTLSGVRCTAVYILHGVRLLRLAQMRMVSDVEIKAAAMTWAEEVHPHRKGRPTDKALTVFTSVARGFLRFHGKLLPSLPVSSRYDLISSRFLLSLQAAGYAPTTIAGTMGPVRSFLFWVAGRNQRLRSIRPDDIALYLNRGRDQGWRLCTVVAQCRALRTFFRHAESRGLCRCGLAETIRSPAVGRHDWEVIGPPWKEVRRMIDRMPDIKAYDCRAKAILLLCAVYGLRNTEVTRLRLEDFDWRGETFAVKRIKRGPWQIFPLQYEVGEAIIHYVLTSRPRSKSANLFLTMVAPFGPLKNLASIVQKQMKIANIESQHYGSHALRHSCATELLRQGTSLQHIAAFLGHRDIRSVSVYAKFDERSLREVANLNLAGVL